MFKCNFFLNNNILIIGASGQLGKYFVNLLSKDNNVIASDITPNSTLDCQFQLLNILDYNSLKKTIKSNNINQIYNLAAILSAKGESFPYKTWNLTTEGFLNVVKVSIECNVDRIFWPSSIAVFGLNSNLEHVLNDVPMLPSSMYGVSKLACEKLMNYYNSKKILDIRSLRFPGIVSATKPGGGTTDYIVEMLYSALSGNEYKCFLDKDRILPMMHIDDSVQASIKLMNIYRKKISINSPYNITSFNISPDLWRNTINSLGYNLKVLFEKDFRDKIAQSWPRNIDDHLFRNDVGWKPKYDSKNTAKSIIDAINS